ncbi:MAG TPA: translation initiation factor IF-2, partial [Opitutaceae bacterium]|nr:translation initiation factor IF-2 [Opitutaceae bacterium]
MSARIHEIAKQYNVEPKEMLAWLKEQGFVSADTRSVSSTVSKIYYDEIAKKWAPAPVTAPVVPAATPAPAPVAVSGPVEEAPKLKLPAGVFVKSAQDIVREKEEAAKAAAAARTAAAPAPAVVPPPVAKPAPAPA